jgi:hypothetical protein
VNEGASAPGQSYWGTFPTLTLIYRRDSAPESAREPRLGGPPHLRSCLGRAGSALLPGPTVPLRFSHAAMSSQGRLEQRLRCNCGEDKLHPGESVLACCRCKWLSHRNCVVVKDERKFICHACHARDKHSRVYLRSYKNSVRRKTAAAGKQETEQQGRTKDPTSQALEPARQVSAELREQMAEVDSRLLTAVSQESAEELLRKAQGARTLADKLMAHHKFQDASDLLSLTSRVPLLRPSFASAIHPEPGLGI